MQFRRNVSVRCDNAIERPGATAHDKRSKRRVNVVNEYLCSVARERPRNFTSDAGRSGCFKTRCLYVTLLSFRNFVFVAYFERAITFVPRTRSS